MLWQDKSCCAIMSQASSSLGTKWPCMQKDRCMRHTASALALSHTMSQELIACILH